MLRTSSMWSWDDVAAAVAHAVVGTEVDRPDSFLSLVRDLVVVLPRSPEPIAFGHVTDMTDTQLGLPPGNGACY